MNSGADEDVASERARSGRRGVSALIRLGVALGVVGLAGGAVWAMAAASTPEAAPVTTDIPALQVAPAPVAPGSATPVSATPAGGGQPVGEQPSNQPANRTGPPQLDAWADAAAARTQIPARALVAYGRAELAMRAEQPGCRLSWATLAGIGRIESNHGQYGGATLGTDGRPSKPIIGVPLDGSPGVRAVPDTDGGRFDGDPTQDRAVGPMQFIPSTWMKFASDGDGDGAGDPQQIDDAALAAGRYLCHGGRDTGTAEGWWSAVLSYNNSVEYAQKVFGLADGYAKSVANGSR